MSSTSQTQMLFDRVATHLLKQGERSKSGGACRYRHGELRCAVGCLIDDFHYSEDLESHAIGGSNAVYLAVCASLGVELSGVDIDLLKSLQAMHDEGLVEGWPRGLRTIAKEFELSSAVIDGHSS